MFNFFRRKGSSEGSNPALHRLLSSSGIMLRKTGSPESIKLDAPLLGGFIEQLMDDGLAQEIDGDCLIGWDHLYQSLAQDRIFSSGSFPEDTDGLDSYTGLADALQLPRPAHGRLVLNNRGTLTDADFSILISGWRLPGGRMVPVQLTGALLTIEGEPFLMSPAQWRLASAIMMFSRRPSEAHNELEHRMAWGRIRAMALEAGADMTDFLASTVVLSPEKIAFAFRRSEVSAYNPIIEIMPGFDGAPEGWLDTFDRHRNVPERYDISTSNGIVQVLVTPRVRTLLQEIKRMPGRRVAGARAQAILQNPFGVLGEGASEVIDESQFVQAREEAGLNYERFVPIVSYDRDERPERIGLLIETASSRGPASSDEVWLTDEELASFIRTAERSIRLGFLLISWQGYELEVQADTPGYVEELRTAMQERLAPQVLVTYDQVYDLSGYSDRIEGVGVEKPVYSPYIAKPDKDAGWFPDSVLPIILYEPRDGSAPQAIATDRASIGKLHSLVDAARKQGLAEVRLPRLPIPLPLGDAEHIVDTFRKVYDDIDTENGSKPDAVGKPKEVSSTDAEVASTGAGGQATDDHSGESASPVPAVAPVRKKALLLRENINSLEYQEARREALTALPSNPNIPRSIRKGVALKKHQQEGLAWMQHLYALRRGYSVHGAILADDMGLGKTFQLLALMASLVEQDPDVDPMLVVAPVSLLENWAEEAAKFFDPGTLPILMAYGSTLNALKVPREQIDIRLRTEDGLVKFLKPGWVNGYRVVLTTYETLRDLEFSFAAQSWSVMVCDEAQRIKNPAAMVTRAAKKQKAVFRIACTGTPVENTLQDMWCLFDYIQPGLLGTLREFGQRYRKPIEARSAEDRDRVEELRERIRPQILRRMKKDVATDLRAKVIVEDCRKLPMSAVQRALYVEALGRYQQLRAQEGTIPAKTPPADTASMGAAGSARSGRRSSKVDSIVEASEGMAPDSALGSPGSSALAILSYLRLICTDPRVRGRASTELEPLAEYRRKAPKMDWLLKQLQTIQDRQEKAIVFCEFREIQRLLQHYIKLVFKYEAVIINGDTSASAKHADSRQKRIRAFQEAQGFGVLILSPVAVGFGVNIQAANHVIHYTRTWNPAKEDQATDRAYRIGQTKDVYVYYPTVAADDFVTFDVKLDQLLTRKRDLADDMLNGSGTISAEEFDLEGSTGRATLR